MTELDLGRQFRRIYDQKTVFVSGHTGFKGSWLCYWLSRLGANVIGYSKDIPTSPSHFELLPRSEVVTSYILDIRDIADLQEILHRHKPDIVFHLAAQSLVRHSYEYPLETFSSNILGTVNMLESCRHVDSIRAFISVTSDKCYENTESGIPFRETDPMGGHDPYSCSKGVSELLTQCFRRSYYEGAQKLLASVRAGNVIGGGDWADDRLIPDLVRATVKGDTTIIRSPNATRPWQHVLEPLSGYLKLGQHLLEKKKAYAEGWNFGPKNNESLKVSQVLTMFKSCWSEMNFRYEESLNNPPEAESLSLDCSKSNQQLNWHPIWDSKQAIEKTVEWYRDYFTSGEILTSAQLLEYSEKAASLNYEWAV